MHIQSIDEVDLRILDCLRENSARSHKEIGELVHLTGQAVGARVRKMEDMGIIEGYTVRINSGKMGQSVVALVTVFIKSNSAHEAFRAFVDGDKRVEEIHRVSGEGCYWLRVRVQSHDELTALLEKILQYGNYKVSMSIGKLKG